jgi:hypothetical protein
MQAKQTLDLFSKFRRKKDDWHDNLKFCILFGSI